MPPPKNGNGPPIIIKRIKKVSGHGHHGVRTRAVLDLTGPVGR